MNENDRAFLPDRIRIPRHALAGWSRVRARLHKNIDAHRLQGDEGVITDARIAAEMIGLCEAALGIGSGIIAEEGAPVSGMIIAEEGAPVYEADDRPMCPRPGKSDDQCDQCRPGTGAPQDRGSTRDRRCRIRIKKRPAERRLGGLW